MAVSSRSQDLLLHVPLFPAHGFAARGLCWVAAGVSVILKLNYCPDAQFSLQDMLLSLKPGGWARTKGCKVATDTEPRHRNLCLGLALDRLLPVGSSHDAPEKSSSPAHRRYRARQKRAWATQPCRGCFQERGVGASLVRTCDSPLLKRPFPQLQPARARTSPPCGHRHSSGAVGSLGPRAQSVGKAGCGSRVQDSRGLPTSGQGGSVATGTGNSHGSLEGRCGQTERRFYFQ